MSFTYKKYFQLKLYIKYEKVIKIWGLIFCRKINCSHQTYYNLHILQFSLKSVSLILFLRDVAWTCSCSMIAHSQRYMLRDWSQFFVNNLEFKKAITKIFFRGKHCLKLSQKYLDFPIFLGYILYTFRCKMAFLIFLWQTVDS